MQEVELDTEAIGDRPVWSAGGAIAPTPPTAIDELPLEDDDMWFVCLVRGCRSFTEGREEEDGA